MAWVPSLVPAMVAGHVKGCGGGLARFSSDSWRIVAAFDLCLDGDTDRHAEPRVAHQRAHPRRADPPPCQRGDTAQTATASGGSSPQYRLHALVAHRISLGRHDHKTTHPRRYAGGVSRKAVLVRVAVMVARDRGLPPRPACPPPRSRLSSNCRHSSDQFVEDCALHRGSRSSCLQSCRDRDCRLSRKPVGASWPRHRCSGAPRSGTR
jgi:hypothetical protein